MCRWFTYLGNEDQLLEDLVLRPRHAIVKQVDEHFLPPGHTQFDPSQAAAAPSTANNTGSPNPQTNMDGFGVGWYTTAQCEYDPSYTSAVLGHAAQRPVVYKNVRPPLNDLVFASIARGTSTRAVLAHVRAAPGLTPVVETNCHPFGFGRHLFAHNGVLGGFAAIRTAVLQYLPLRYQVAILGTTDAEHVAALYFFRLCGEDGDWNALYNVGGMAKAMRETIELLEGMRREFAGAGEGIQEDNVLNLVVTSGSSLVAVRYASPKGLEPPSLYYSTTAGPTLNRKYKGAPDEERSRDPVVADDERMDKERHAKHVVVASEPSTLNPDEWELVEPSQMVLVDQDLHLRLESL
ncbi:N-terminal nucleophile aminohydrolase (glutamine amidotransferase class-II) [Colletotrichum plurivorum]|uniref:N-terminal nucleophile aminohydrolase (Glutamine amidotransferase class-II) n=1 Tax=Colletotrichum plurivorum TaxID=2175906 RepID=A0A8H6K5D0_9PEZI|nr:N-terminal nucleophile aminohydrolase (glutamine amidotransferase class-II) [Colletotrichum plurivorum]